MQLVLAATPQAARMFIAEYRTTASDPDVRIITSVQMLEGLRFQYTDVIRVPGWSQRSDIEAIEDRILRTHVTSKGIAEYRFHERDGVDWDIDANLPTYTRDYLKMIQDGKLDNICTYGTELH